MGLHHLKALRVGVALVIFTLIALVFLDFHNLVAPSIARGLLCLQFVPSLLQYVNTAALGAGGFIVVVVLTLLFGRVYCSTLCPLGTLQDMIGFLARRKRQRRGFHFSKPHTALRYSILALTVLLLVSGSGLLLNLVDPFSSFGRISADLFRPVLLFLNNLAAVILEQGGGVHPSPTALGGICPGRRQRIDGDAAACRLACRNPRTPLLQHNLPGRNAAWAFCQVFVAANRH